MSNVSVIAEAVKEALDLWKTFIATRQQAYERGMDKKQQKAIQIGEEGFEAFTTFLNLLSKTYPVTGENDELMHLRRTIFKLKQKFNRYD